jgi:hypothetical protein
MRHASLVILSHKRKGQLAGPHAYISRTHTHLCSSFLLHPYSLASVFRAMSYPTEKLNDAVDLTHHISDYAKRFRVSPLKGLQKYFRKDGMIMLAGGAFFYRLDVAGAASLRCGSCSEESRRAWCSSQGEGGVCRRELCASTSAGAACIQGLRWPWVTDRAYAFGQHAARGGK